MLDLVDILVAIKFSNPSKYSGESFQPVASASTGVALLRPKEPANQVFAIFVELLDLFPICRLQIIPRVFAFIFPIALQYAGREMVNASSAGVIVRGRGPLLNDMSEFVR